MVIHLFMLREPRAFLDLSFLLTEHYHRLLRLDVSTMTEGRQEWQPEENGQTVGWWPGISNHLSLR
jgi:hypothetical protein